LNYITSQELRINVLELYIKALSGIGKVVNKGMETLSCGGSHNNIFVLFIVYSCTCYSVCYNKGVTNIFSQIKYKTWEKKPFLISKIPKKN
jgi:hypothetical protein